MRKPELVHVFVEGTDGPEIVQWQLLMQDAEVCNRAFRIQRASQERVQQAAEDMVGEAGRRLEAVEKLAAAAELVEAQEHQAWCELPLREVACTDPEPGGRRAGYGCCQCFGACVHKNWPVSKGSRAWDCAVTESRGEIRTEAHPPGGDPKRLG